MNKNDSGKMIFRLTSSALLRGAVVASFLSLSLITGACAQQSEGQGKAPKEAAFGKAVSTYTIPVQGMSCGSCVSNVKKTVKALDGVQDVEVNLEKREAKVSFARTEVSPEEIQKTINELGYKAGKPVEVKDQK
jgi:copper ion binding protein